MILVVVYCKLPVDGEGLVLLVPDDERGPVVIVHVVLKYNNGKVHLVKIK